MKRVMELGLLASVVVVLTFVLSTSTPAVHDPADLVCNQCHTMHASVDGADPDVPIDSDGTAFGGPNVHLLYASSTSDACLVCHDNEADAPNVLTAGSGELPGGQFTYVDTTTYLSIIFQTLL